LILFTESEVAAMNKIIQIIAASAAAVCGFLFGEFDGLMYALIAFMVLDYTSLTSVMIAQDCVYYPTSFPAGCVVNFYPD